MTPSTAYTLASVLITSAVALVCLVTMGWDEAKFRARMPILISIASGVLLGEAVFHLLPESFKRGIPVPSIVGLAMLGLAFSFAVEFGCNRFLTHSEIAPVARISLFAESIHNAVDGAIIAVAYMTNIRVGVVATVAIVIHEVPHELGNFSILIHGGYGRMKAFAFNLLSACAAILGAAAVLILGKSLYAYSAFALPPAAGCFIYIAAFNLLPHLWRESNPAQRASLRFGTSAGVALMLIVHLAG